MASNRGVIQTIFEEYNAENDHTFSMTVEYNMPIPSIDISCSEMLSFSIALTCLYRWNRYRAFGTDIVRNLEEASLAFIFAVFCFASPANCIASVAREMLII